MRALKVPLLFVNALFTILTTRKLFLLYIIPWLLGILVFFLTITSLFSYHSVIEQYIFGASDSWYQYLFYVATLIIELLAASVFALAVSLVLADFYIERFVCVLFERKGIIVDEGLRGRDVVSSLGFAVVDNLKRLLYVGFLGLLVFVLGWFPPFLLVVMVLTFFIAGFDGFDLPLQLRGEPIAARFRMSVRRWPETLLMGACYTAMLVIPFVGLLGLPLCYFVAVELITRSNDLGLQK